MAVDEASHLTGWRSCAVTASQPAVNTARRFTFWRSHSIGCSRLGAHRELFAVRSTCALSTVHSASPDGK